MSSNSESESRIRQGLDERVAEEMERIDDEFLSGLSDSRLESGVPEDEQAQDLEFIQMSGLTYRDTGEEDASQAAGSQSPQPPDAASRPAEPPLTFYEKGVADVDAEMTPGIVEDSVSPEADTIHGAEDSSPIAELRDIIADLSRDFVDSGAASGPRAGAEKNTEPAGAQDESIREADDDPDAGQYPQSVADDVALQEDGRLEAPGDHENDSASPSMTASTDQEEAQEEAVEADPYWDEEIAAAKESQEPAEEQGKEADAAPDTDDPAEMPLADRPDDSSPEDTAGTGEALQADSAFIDSPGGENHFWRTMQPVRTARMPTKALPVARRRKLAVMEARLARRMPVGESLAESSDAVSENETLQYDEPETAPIVDHLNGPLEDRFAAVMEDIHDEPPVPDVREAEALIRELEAQPRADAGDDFDGGEPASEEDGRAAARELPAALVPAAGHTVAEAPRASAAGERTVTRRQKSHTRGRLARRLIRLCVVLVVLAALTFGVYQAWLFAKQQLSTPDALLSQARIAAAREEHSGAAAHYKRAASLLPAREPRRAEALFGAALNVFSRPGMEGQADRRRCGCARPAGGIPAGVSLPIPRRPARKPCGVSFTVELDESAARPSRCLRESDIAVYAIPAAHCPSSGRLPAPTQNWASTIWREEPTFRQPASRTTANPMRISSRWGLSMNGLPNTPKSRQPSASTARWPSSIGSTPSSRLESTASAKMT